MPQLDRAAQFSSFAALTGYDEAVAETGRQTDEKVELSEDEKEAISQRLQMIQEHIAEHPEVTITYFVPDKKKSGGAYQSVTGAVRKIDEYERMIMLYNQESIKPMRFCRFPASCSKAWRDLRSNKIICASVHR